MDSDKRMPSDVPGGQDESGRAHNGAADLASRAAERIRDGYERTKEKLADIDPRDTLRDAGRYVQESGESAVETVERHPFAAFAIGALSVGLIAWATTGRRTASWQPDTSGWADTLRDYGDEALRAGHSLLGSGREQLERNRDYLARGRDYLDSGRDYAREGGRMLLHRSEREPLAAILGVGLALYLVGSLFSGGGTSQAQPARRRTKR
jgi:hypothetical protein